MQYKHQKGSVSPEIANIETQTKSSVTNCPTYQYRTTPRCSNHFQVCSVRVVDSETMSHRGQSATYISQVCSQYVHTVSGSVLLSHDSVQRLGDMALAVTMSAFVR